MKMKMKENEILQVNVYMKTWCHFTKMVLVWYLYGTCNGTCMHVLFTLEIANKSDYIFKCVVV